MASSKVFRRIFLTLMLYLASTPSLAHSEPNFQVNARSINTTYSENPNPSHDTRYPSFISNVFKGLDVANTLVGHPVPLVEIVTSIPPGSRPSSKVRDFKSIQLFVHLASTAEIACLSSRQPWGKWESDFSYRRPISPEQVVTIPIPSLHAYDQWRAFSSLPASLGPWLTVFLRARIVEHRSVLGWYFGNPETGRCALLLRNPDSTWYVHAEPMSICQSYQLPANVSVPQTFSLDDANTNFSSSSNPPPSAAGTNAPQVALPMQGVDGFNKTEGNYKLVATS